MASVVKSFLLDWQSELCAIFEKLDGKAQFLQDHWQYDSGNGGGRTHVLEKGGVFEKAGVNFSHISGDALPEAATKGRPHLAGSPFEAMGVSVVVHPENPYIPTTHANLRFFIVNPADGEPVWWFGGGFDLTPYYGFEEDCRHWHQRAKLACDPFGDGVYLQYKKQCDDYFYLPHRKEARGIGGLFFDDVNEEGFDKSFDLLKSVGEHFIKAYEPIVLKRKDHVFSQRERDFQCYRRGRYVEFNLVWDRGTLFGLQSGGRTESILMSLPPAVSWHYDFKPEKGSEELKLTAYFLQRRDWLS